MTIKSDKWIRRQCEAPMIEKICDSDLTMTEREVGDTLRHRLLSDYRMCDPKRVAEFKPMIEPFEPGQVRALNECRLCSREGIQSGSTCERCRSQLYARKIVSYGTSSYGYDARCAPEFKVFTNINSAVIDPKNFTDDSFVAVDGSKDGYVLLPPHSFALARTVEWYRIPRNVLVICLGKSTYARCGIIVNVTPLEPEWEGHVTLEFSNTTPLPAKIYVNEGCCQFLFFESDEQCETSYKDRGGKYQGQSGVTLPRT